MTPRSLRATDLADPRPVYAVWELTLGCDQACRHCGSRAGRARPDELDRGEALDLVRQLAEVGVREVTLIGGEAYLRADWTDIAEAVVAHGMRCTLVTGGRAFTPARAAEARRAGVHAVSVSVDGLAATHDALRAVPGSHTSAMAALDAVVGAGMLAAVNTQINLANHQELDAIGDEIAAHGARGWQLQLTTPMGRAADQARLVLQPWHLLEVVPTLAALKRRLAPRRLLVQATNNIGYFGPYEEVVRAGGHWIGCTGGQFSIGVQSDGTIKGCSSLPEGRFGELSVRDAPLREILVRSEALAALRDRGPAELWGFCGGCYYAEECRGGCVWTAHTLLGRPGNMPYCYHRAETLRARGRRERLVREAPGAGRPNDRGEWRLVEEDWVA